MLRFSDGRMRCRVISMMPNGEIFRILVRARSRLTASRMAFSTPRRCFSSRMSMKSLTMMPPRSRRRSWRAISLAALDAGDFFLDAVFMEHRIGFAVALDAVGVARHDDLQELLSVGEGGRFI